MTAHLQQFAAQHSSAEKIARRWQTIQISHGLITGRSQHIDEAIDQLAEVIADQLSKEALQPGDIQRIGQELAQVASMDSLELGKLTTALIQRIEGRVATGVLAGWIGELTTGFLAARPHLTVPETPLAEAQHPPFNPQFAGFSWTTDTELNLTSRTGTDDFVFFQETTAPIIEHDLARQMHQQALAGSPTQFNFLSSGHIYRAWIAPIRSADDRISGTVGCAIDLSEQLHHQDSAQPDLPWYRALIESIDGVVYESDVEQNRYTFVSQRAEALAGYPLAQWLDEDNFWTTTIHPDDLSRVTDELHSKNHLEPTYQIEYRLRTAAGEWRWVSNFFAIMRGENQRLVARGVIFDISRHRQTEDALHRSEERFRAIFDHAGAGIALLDNAGDVALVNNTLEQMLGYTADELRGKPLSGLSHEDDHGIGPVFFAEMVRGQRDSFQAEKRYLHKAGQMLWANLTVTTMHEDDNSEFLAICVIEDTTARKAAEERLRHQLSLTQATISSFRGGLCALDRDGRVTFANPAAEQALGWSEDELLNTNFFDRVHSTDPTDKMTPESWRSSTQQGQTLEHDDALFMRRDGTTFCAGYTLAPILEDGSVIGAVLSFRDLTEQKRFQGELTAVNRLLAESREQAQQHLARELHDRALQVLIGISYQLGRRIASDSDAELKDVRQSVLEVVAQLRALLGELRPAGLEELGLTTALEGYVARLQREAGPHSPEITLDVDQGSLDLPLPVARCLFRVAQEGLRNAMRHAQPSHVGVQLRLTEDIATLTIRDDGRGFSVPSSLTALTQSNHFGLVGMAERVALAGGQLSIRSQIDRGTTVSLQLPRSPDAQPIGRGQVELTSTLILQTTVARGKE